MTNKQILKKAFEKAEQNGYPSDTVAHLLEPDTLLWWTIGWRYYAIIFRHDFPKAFWGEKLYICSYCSCQHSKKHEFCCLCGKKGILKWWKFHLQQMVLKEECLKYLEQFLKG